MKVDIGSLNKRIEILRREISVDNDGFQHQTSVPVRRCWAAFSRQSGKELTRENADFGEVRVRFLIRSGSFVWDRQLLADRKMAVLYNGTEYEIEHANDYGDAREFTELLCVWTGKEALPE